MADIVNDSAECDVGTLFAAEDDSSMVKQTYEFCGKAFEIKAMPSDGLGSQRYTVQGRVVWRGAPRLAKYLTENEDNVWSYFRDCNKCTRAIELGAGCGLVGIVFAYLCGLATDVTITDYDKDVVALIGENIERNFPAEADSAHVHAMAMDWRDPIDDASPLHEAFQFAFASDVTHATERYAELFRTAYSLLEKGGHFLMINHMWIYFAPDVCNAGAVAGFKVLKEVQIPGESFMLTVFEKP